MVLGLAARLDRLEAALRAQVQAPLAVKRVIIEDGDELPREADGELLIVRRIVAAPERPEEPALEPPPRPPAPKRREEAKAPPPDPHARFKKPFGSRTTMAPSSISTSNIL